jgi:hypothetical protein
MNIIPTPIWIVDEWFSNPKIHGIQGTHGPWLPRDKVIMEAKSMQQQDE